MLWFIGATDARSKGLNGEVKNLKIIVKKNMGKKDIITKHNTIMYD